MLHALSRLPQLRLRGLPHASLADALADTLTLYRTFLYAAGRYPANPFPRADFVAMAAGFVDLLVHVLADSPLYTPAQASHVQVPQTALEEAMLVEFVLCEEMAAMEPGEVVELAQLVYDTYARAGLYRECVGVGAARGAEA